MLLRRYHHRRQSLLAVGCWITALVSLSAVLAWKFNWWPTNSEHVTGELFSAVRTQEPSIENIEPSPEPTDADDDPIGFGPQSEPILAGEDPFRQTRLPFKGDVATRREPGLLPTPTSGRHLEDSKVVGNGLRNLLRRDRQQNTTIDLEHGQSEIQTVNYEEEQTVSSSSAEQFQIDLSSIDRQIQNGDINKAHTRLSTIYRDQPHLRGMIQPRINETARLVYFSPQPHVLPPYEIQPGDQLRIIARQYRVSWQYLEKLNRVDPRRIRPGQKLKVISGPFSAVVDLPEFQLTVYLGEHYVRTYRVGIGKESSTPLGRLAVLGKVVNPQYTAPDGSLIEGGHPHNPLGERWIDLGDGYGIHGTIEPNSIGRAESRGCIRMLNADVEEVYDLLGVGSKVEIRR